MMAKPCSYRAGAIQFGKPCRREFSFGTGDASGKCIEQRPCLNQTSAIDRDHDLSDCLGKLGELRVVGGESIAIHVLILSNTCSICKAIRPIFPALSTPRRNHFSDQAP
ncbi:unannotated protein [freshwater metagenome]|uniref:Unannotated protein n=1 Tax=freshwater metagenome TaxID=449393 RepID=A0A6J7I911_9ZZZZ